MHVCKDARVQVARASGSLERSYPLTVAGTAPDSVVMRSSPDRIPF